MLTMAVTCRNFRLADLVTIMNGVCGSLSIFSSAHYLLSNDPDYLWTALSLPLAGLMFDFLDGKVARWRKSTSLLGQELDSLADLVRSLVFIQALVANINSLDILRRCSGVTCVRSWFEDVPRHSLPDWLYLLWSRTSCSLQCNGRTCPQERSRKSKLFRGVTNPHISWACRCPIVLGKE